MGPALCQTGSVAEQAPVQQTDMALPHGSQQDWESRRATHRHQHMPFNLIDKEAPCGPPTKGPFFSSSRLLWKETVAMDSKQKFAEQITDSNEERGQAPM